MVVPLYNQREATMEVKIKIQKYDYQHEGVSKTIMLREGNKVK